MELREAWLASVDEEILDPTRPILDPHFHFFEDGGAFPAYGLADLQRDTSRHNVTGAIYMECEQGYRSEGPAHLRPVGESERVLERSPNQLEVDSEPASRNIQQHDAREFP